MRLVYGTLTAPCLANTVRQSKGATSLMVEPSGSAGKISVVHRSRGYLYEYMTDRRNPPNIRQILGLCATAPTLVAKLSQSERLIAAELRSDLTSSRAHDMSTQQARNRPKSLARLACLQFTNTQSVSSFNSMQLAGSLNLGKLTFWHLGQSLQHETSCDIGHNLGLWHIHCLTFEHSTSAIRRPKHTAHGEGLRSRGHMDSLDRSK
jgi:hypothetical protein